MNIIKDKQITTNNWIHIADTALPASGDITLALNRWKDEKSSIALYDGKIGIRLAPSDSIEDIANDLKDLALIALEFTVFTDGRSFSQARILRDKYQYIKQKRDTDILQLIHTLYNNNNIYYSDGIEKINGH